MNRRNLQEAGVFLGMLAVGLVARQLLQPWPNVFPALAIAMFAGFYFRSLLVAAMLPLLIQGITDTWISGYDPMVKGSVYLMLAMPVLARGVLRGRSRVVARPLADMSRNWVAIAGSGWVAATAFFVVTNLAVYWSWHDHTWSELRSCFALAIPFYRVTLESTLLGAFALLGGHQLLGAVLSLGETTAKTTGLAKRQPNPETH